MLKTRHRIDDRIYEVHITEKTCDVEKTNEMKLKRYVKKIVMGIIDKAIKKAESRERMMQVHSSRCVDQLR